MIGNHPSINDKSPYHILAGRQHLFNHHAVPREGAAVERVGPVRTEGTQTWARGLERCAGSRVTETTAKMMGGGSR